MAREKTGKDGVTFPKAMSNKKAHRWLDAHNPYPAGTTAEAWFAVAFWNDQADKHWRGLDRVNRFALWFYGTLGALLIVLLIAGVIVTVNS